MRLVDMILSSPAVYKMRQSKFSVTAFLHNQNLLSHECTHHVYARDFIAAVQDKEREYAHGLCIKKQIQSMLGNIEKVEA